MTTYLSPLSKDILVRHHYSHCKGSPHMICVRIFDVSTSDEIEQQYKYQVCRVYFMVQKRLLLHFACLSIFVFIFANITNRMNEKVSSVLRDIS